MSFLISVQELQGQLAQGQPIKLIDVRFNLQDAAWGLQNYQQAHLPHAVYMDLDKDLSSTVQQHGGRHPLPDVATFSKKLGDAGISRHDRVVVYDQANAMYAVRLWWMLCYYGMTQVQVLDGGLAAWQEAGYPLSSEDVQPQAVYFEAEVQAAMVVEIDTVEARITAPTTCIIDARDAKRYSGAFEPRDAKAGHIPSAINKPFVNNLSENRYKSKEALQALYTEAADAEEVIVYCGSGVTACHNILAMSEAGIARDKMKLYVGSWSDWSSYEDKDVVQEL